MRVVAHEDGVDIVLAQLGTNVEIVGVPQGQQGTLWTTGTYISGPRPPESSDLVASRPDTRT